MANFARKDELIARHKAKSGLRGRIDANCIDCVYDPGAPGNWRKQVQECAVDSCPLWDIRARSRAE